jgi:hypothetical protein
VNCNPSSHLAQATEKISNLGVRRKWLSTCSAVLAAYNITIRHFDNTEVFPYQSIS